jgi:single-strand DNA-binding protein
MSAINRVVLTGGLTRDPELRHTPDGTPVVTMRLGFTTVHLVEGEWRERPNYIDVETWATQAENAAKYLARGSQIAVDGRLQWSEYETNGRKRQVHKVVAEMVQYLPRTGGGGRDPSTVEDAGSAVSDGAVAAGSDDIPF